MSRVLLDTHVWAWSLLAHERLSARAIEAINSAETVSVSAISLYEIGQKVRLGKWPEMVAYFPDLMEIAEQQGSQLLPLSQDVCMMASVLDWDHRDPFDRFIGSAALLCGFVLISADAVFDDLATQTGWQGRLW